MVLGHWDHFSENCGKNPKIKSQKTILAVSFVDVHHSYTISLTGIYFIKRKR